MQILRFLQPPPFLTPIVADPQQMRQKYRYWRNRILYSTIIGYALFYLVRKNLSLAMPGMEADLGISKSDLGLFLTLHGLVYGLSRFANGFAADRLNPRYFMAIGLLAAAWMNIFFGLSSAIWAFGLFWLLNGWFQGMGFPPCVRSLTSWFSPKERGTKFSIWNSSHSIGAATVMLLNSFLVSIHWRLCLLVPAMVAMAGAVFIINRLRDTPQSLGLPPVEVYTQDVAEEEAIVKVDGENFKKFVRRKVFANPAIWLISFANFFVYVVRYAIVDWGPTFLKELKGVELHHAGWMVAGYEVFGIAGMLCGGLLMDRVFRGYGTRTCFFYMTACAIGIFIFWQLKTQSAWINALLLCIIGFFIYGPQCLIGVIAANLATKRAAATANGVTGLFGYLSGILSGWGIGWIVQHSGWQGGFSLLIFSATAAAVLFVFCWHAK